MIDNSNSCPYGPVPSDHAPALEFDCERYNAALGEDLDLTEIQRTEMLTTLWAIMQNMVELGFSVADFDICGSIFGEFSAAANPGTDEIESPSKPDRAGAARGKAEDDVE